MGLNINKKYDKTYKYYNAKHNITRMLRYINIYIKQIILKVKIMKTRKHFIRKYELLVRCIQTNLEFFIA